MKIRLSHLIAGVVAFNIGLLAITFGLSKQAERQNPMVGALVTTDTSSIHVMGTFPGSKGEPSESVYDALVLIHGASTSALDFKNNLLAVLAEDYPVVALDRPGHGYSDRGASKNMDNPMQQATVILDTLSRMGIVRPVLIGHSWAGSVVLAASLLQHDSVEVVAGILIAGVSHPYEREDSRPTRWALAPFFGPIFRWEYMAPIGRMAIAPTVERSFSPDEVPENYIKDTGLYLSLRPKTYLYNALDRSRLVEHLNVQSREYETIDLPILSIAATEDVVVPPENHHEKLLLEIPDIEGVEIIGAGHSPHQTRTDEVVSAIRGFVDGLSQRGLLHAVPR